MIVRVSTWLLASPCRFGCGEVFFVWSSCSHRDASPSMVSRRTGRHCFTVQSLLRSQASQHFHVSALATMLLALWLRSAYTPHPCARSTTAAQRRAAIDSLYMHQRSRPCIRAGVRSGRADIQSARWEPRSPSRLPDFVRCDIHVAILELIHSESSYPLVPRGAV
jgi:hypothetical protein